VFGVFGIVWEFKEVKRGRKGCLVLFGRRWKGVQQNTESMWLVEVLGSVLYMCFKKKRKVFSRIRKDVQENTESICLVENFIAS
jgi:hypothetical protein